MTTFLRPFSSKRAELERRLASDEITARGSRDYGSSLTRLRLVVSMLLLLTVGSGNVWGQTEITALSQITDANGNYIIKNDISGGAPGVSTFSGTLTAQAKADGTFPVISGLSAPLFTTATNATISNIILDQVSISQAGITGSIACTANGTTSIYNCGILSGSVGSTGTSSSDNSDDCCGGLVGFLDGTARVINCYSYATITGGNRVGGIVGYNNYQTTSASDKLKTMVMNCMFYGDITGGQKKAPIYHGKKITNAGNTAVGNYNYFNGEASYVKNNQIDMYYCALMAETRFLQHFEFYRYFLNSNRELAAWWATGDRANKDLMAKWVLETADRTIANPKPYPILKAQRNYPSIINYDAKHAPRNASVGRNKGVQLGTLTVKIQKGSGGAQFNNTDATITTSQLKLIITDKDYDHFNYNYYKVQLPYYNDVGTGNYTNNRVVTGWKIVSIVGGTPGTFKTGADDAVTDDNGNITSAPYNFADRYCTNKDLYGTNGSNRVFNQGAYWDVPEGVTEITIEPYWAKAAYIADAYADVVYNASMTTPYNVPNVGGGQIYTNDVSTFNGDDDQKVYTNTLKSDGTIDKTAIANALAVLSPNNKHTVYDYAVVLVGNYHQYNNINNSDKPYTVTSVDLNHDNEPDYSFICRFDGRTTIHPVKYDFLNLIGLGMAQKSTGSKGSYNFGIPQPKYWFEVTNTALFRVTQMEYSPSGRAKKPIIMQGGVIEQWVTQQQDAGDKVEYFHVGSNVWFKEFHRGSHQDNAEKSTPHPPLSVTGGDYEKFYLTGAYQPLATNYNDDAECYINGGRFGTIAGAGMEGIGDATNHTKGNIIWQIDNADIKEFFGGGLNGEKSIQGNITTIIRNSHVELFCGGPKFGDMNSGRTVKTTATNCHFGTYFGAGYGGNSYYRAAPANFNSDKDPWKSTDDKQYNLNWNEWIAGTIKSKLNSGNYPGGIAYNGYKQDYISAFGGVSVGFDYQFLPMSNNTANVARLFIDFVSFSLATTYDVTSNLTGCTITGNFYGGGSLGAVNGPVTSTLTDCTVDGSVYGAGYSASLPTISVMPTTGFKVEPNYDKNTGVFIPGELPDYEPEVYHWQYRETVNSTETAIDKENHILYTTRNLNGLGAVSGNVILNINGSNTTVGGNVFGGGEESNVLGDTQVNMNGGTIAQNVYGGGKGVADEFACTKAMIGINDAGAVNPDPAATKDKGTIVNISDGTVNGNVYGGGEVGRVEWNTQVTIGEENGTGEPVVEGYVFGAGKGLKTHGYAALVRGNPTVTIQGNAKIKKSVYGGGEIASVARYKVASTAEEAAEHGVEIGTPYALANNYSGNCKVIVGGNAVIGPDEPMKMVHPEITDGTDKPDDFGHVFAAGKGVLPEVYTYADNEHRPKRMLLYNAGSLPEYWEYADSAHINIWEYFKDEEAYFAFVKTLALSSKTEVTIKDKAFVKGSVYGGSENGLVQFDTDVKIQGGQIGCGKNTTEAYGDEVWEDDYTPSGDLECASWDYGKDTNDDGKKDQFAPYDPYAKYLNPADKKYYYDPEFTKYAEGGANIATDGHTYYGNVFGGGSGSVPYFDTEKGVSRYISSAGMVKGNTKVTISGGHILTNVYGGCEATNVLGSATITMTGGTVGVPRTFSQIVAHPVTCYIFGAGKGDQRIFFNKETNVDRATVTVEGGKVYGSVFGGGEDGHVFQNTTVTIGETGEDGPTIGTLGTSYVDGNVFGGGRGFSGDALTAGNVGGSVELNIKSGKILGSVYGGGRLASVGYGLYLVDEKIKEDGDSIKPYGILRPNDKYDGSYADPSTKAASDYYDKGRGYITINISGGTIGNDLEYIYNPTAEQKAKIPNTTFDYQNHLQYTKGGNVFTGGMGRLYALDNTTLLPLWPKLGKCKGTTLNMTGGTVKSSIYGGGEIGAVAQNATLNINGGTVGTKVVDKEDATKYYYFGSVFGGGKGSVENITYPSGTAEADKIPISEAGTTGGKVAVNLNKTVASDDDAKGAIVSQVFGCNDMNGSPKDSVTVHIYATQNADKDNISSKYDKGSEKFDVLAVYGGGNLAAYEPTSLTGTTKVIIDGCGLTSVRQVYGGGNAASTPATDVEINGTYEILELFGGGNGYDKLPNGSDNPGANVGYKDYHLVEDQFPTKEDRVSGNDFAPYRYGSGEATVNIKGGTIHRVFGGSNTKGNVRKTALTMLEELQNNGEPVCQFQVDEAYGGGKSAPMDAEAKLHMACIPGLQEAYGGAEAADIHDNVTLTITNGTFNRVFGGNNISGTISGKITVNVEETGCRPVVIGELYGGGNLAAYSIYGYNDDGTPKESGDNPFDDPEVNVRSFTSIGAVYGGGYGTGAKMIASPTVNINESVGSPDTYPTTGDYDENGFKGKTITLDKGKETEHKVTLPAHTKGKMGAIGDVFGGGNAAEVMGNTTVNIGTLSDNTFVSLDDDPATTETDESKKPVLGADIRGNVYGGGNNAEVTGNTNVVIGKKNENQ